MERLTHPRVSGIKTGYWTQSKKDELVARLAAYEDTGFEPEEIRELNRKYGEVCEEASMLRLEMANKSEAEPKNAAKIAAELPKPLPKSQLEKDGAGQQALKKVKKDEPTGVPGPYKGFMHIKCPECGTIKNFCAKKETEIFYCDHCRAKVHLEDMAKVLLKCECGKIAVYYTNRYDEAFDIECVQCEAPVCVEWNRKAGRYTTVKDGGHR